MLYVFRTKVIAQDQWSDLPRLLINMMICLMQVLPTILWSKALPVDKEMEDGDQNDLELSLPRLREDNSRHPLKSAQSLVER